MGIQIRKQEVIEDVARNHKVEVNEKMQRKDWLAILGLFGLWRSYLLLVAWIGLYVRPEFVRSFPYADTRLFHRGHPLFWSWANFDGVHYMGLAEWGYHDAYSEVFFPVYPAMMRLVMIFTQESLRAGLWVSHISLILALGVLFQIGLLLGLSRRAAYWLLGYMLVFPTSFYLGSVYTESVFLLWSGLCVLGLLKNWYWLAGITGGLAAATKVTGVLLLTIAADVMWKKRSWQAIWMLMLPLGLALYMSYLWKTHGDPLYFVHAQSLFSAHRQVDSWVLLPQVWWRYAKILATVPWWSPSFVPIIQELASSILFAWLSWVTFKKFGWGMGLYTATSFVLPTLTGSFSSLPRYVLVLFPAFGALTAILEAKPWAKWVYLLVCFALLTLNTIWFTRGLWIA